MGEAEGRAKNGLEVERKGGREEERTLKAAKNEPIRMQRLARVASTALRLARTMRWG